MLPVLWLNYTNKQITPISCRFCTRILPRMRHYTSYQYQVSISYSVHPPPTSCSLFVLYHHISLPLYSLGCCYPLLPDVLLCFFSGIISCLDSEIIFQSLSFSLCILYFMSTIVQSIKLIELIFYHGIQQLLCLHVVIVVYSPSTWKCLQIFSHRKKKSAPTCLSD